MTAALVMQCVDEGSISLDAPVVEQLPGFLLADPEALRLVTPRHLMSMSSGLDTDPDPPNVDYGRGDDALTRFVHSLKDLAQVFAPGEGFSYSDASTNISGRLVEHVTGETWDEVLRTRLLEPAGLEHSATLTEDIIHRRFAVGHQPDGSGSMTVRHIWGLSRAEAPCGTTLFSTATDLIRFGQLFIREGLSRDGNRVIPANAVALMQERHVPVPPTLVADWWGLGPSGRTWDGVDVMGHPGTTPAGSAYLLWTADRDLVVATTVNAPRAGYPFAERIFKTLFDSLADIEIPGRPAPPGDVEVSSERLVGRYSNVFQTFTVAPDGGTLTVAVTSRFPDSGSTPASVLEPLSPTTFLPSDPAIDGGRGTAIAFLGPETAPATHLVNGLHALRRITGPQP